MVTILLFYFFLIKFYFFRLLLITIGCETDENTNSEIRLCNGDKAISETALTKSQSQNFKKYNLFTEVIKI